VVKRNKKYAFERVLGSSDDLTPTLFRTILHVFPVLGPLLAPLESSTATNADFWLEAILGLWD
jgi:hypothetical protein